MGSSMTGQNVKQALMRLTGEKQTEALALVFAIAEEVKQAARTRDVDARLSAECEGAAHGYAFRLREMLYDAK